MDLSDKLDSNARVGVRKGTGTTYERRRISLIEGTNVSFTVADDPTSEEVDVTVAVASAAPSGSAGGTLGGTYPNPTVNTDGSTLETSASALRVKDGGITQAKLASGYRATYSGTSAPAGLAQGDVWADTTNKLVMAYDGSASQRIAHYASSGRTGGRWSRAANQTFSNVTVTDITWDTEDFDSDGFLTPSSATFTIPSGLGGLYDIVVTSTPQFSATVTGANYYLTVGGTVVWMQPLGGDATTSGTVSHSMSIASYPLAAGDACKIRFIHNSGASRDYRFNLYLNRAGI